MGRQPKILIWDVETSDMTVTIDTYQLKNRIRYFNPADITRDWVMFGAAWKWWGEDQVHCVSIKPDDPFNDYGVVRAIHEVIQEADMLVGHNSDAFDYKKLNTRAIQYDLHPLRFRPKDCVDTLKYARKYFKFSSNKLSYIANYLGLDAKDESPDWNKIKCGDPDEIRYMRKYNKQDVFVTEQVYDRLKGYDERHPDMAAIAEIKDVKGKNIPVCKVCTSYNTFKNGHSYNRKRTKMKQRYVCNDCNSSFVFGDFIPYIDMKDYF